MSFPLAVTTTQYISCTATGIVSIPLLYMVFRSINQSCIGAKRHQLNNGKTIPICSILSLSSFALMLIFSFVVFVVIIIVQQKTLIADRLLGASWAFYAIGLWIMMFIYVLRLDVTFKYSHELSILSYPKWLINLMYAFLVIIGILLAIIVIFISSGFRFNQITLYISIITLILYIVFTITLLCLFFRKLFVIMNKRLENDIINNKSEDIEDDEKGALVIELITLNSMIKYCLLVLFGIISTYIGNILVVIALTDENLPPYTFVAVDILINSISLYFMFSFNNDQYNKCCSKCHNGCKQLCISWIFSKYKDTLSVKQRQQYEALILE